MASLASRALTFLSVRGLPPRPPLRPVNEKKFKRVPTRSLSSLVGYGLRGRVMVNFVAMVRVSKLSGSNIN